MTLIILLNVWVLLKADADEVYKLKKVHQAVHLKLLFCGQFTKLVDRHHEQKSPKIIQSNRFEKKNY